MMEYETAGFVRLVGLVGLGFSICLWAVAERSGGRKMLLPMAAGAAFLFAFVYVLGLMATDESGVTRFLPQFP